MYKKLLLMVPGKTRMLMKGSHHPPHHATTKQLPSNRHFHSPQEGIAGIRNDEVRTEMLTTLFTDLSKHFYKFADLDYEFWFLENLRFLLPSINTDLLELIPGDLSFPAYTAT